MADGGATIVRLLPKLRPFVERKARHKVARGGRGGGKSWCVARLLLLMGSERKLRVLCAREVQKSIKDSVHKLLADQIEAMNMAGFYDIQATTIKGLNGTEFVFTGLRDHTSDSIKSFEGIDICWIEEAARVSQHSAMILIPTIRKAGSELWWSYNPDQSDDFVHADIAKRDDALVIDVGYQDNPWFPAELEQERVALKAINDDLYRHVWEGECRSAAGLLFKRAWFKFYDRLPERLSLYMASDYAVSEGDGDYTEHGIAGLDEHGDLYLVDWYSDQAAPETWIEAAVGMIRRNKPKIWFEEKGVILRAVDASITKRLRERETFIMRYPLASAGNKADRALGFAARASAGAVWLPKTPWAERLLNQLCSFTGEDGRTDDGVDVCSLLARGLDVMANASAPQTETRKQITPFTRAWLEHNERADEAKTAEFYS
jgi:predicted phage terminase large subunit-like protein